MKTKFFITFFLILFSYIYPYKYEKQEQRSFKLGDAESVKLTNINGIIKLSTNPQNKVSIKAIKLANKKEDLDNVKIEYKFKEKILNIIAKRDKKKTKVVVNFYISVPEKTKFVQLNSTNGRIEVIGDYQNLNLKSKNGEIEFEGNFENGVFIAINGSINLYLSKVLQGNAKATTENGSVKIELNNESSFTIEGSSLNGYIKSDFDLPIKKGFVTTKISGSVNQGKNKIFIKTTNGSIKLLKI